MKRRYKVMVDRGYTFNLDGMKLRKYNPHDEFEMEPDGFIKEEIAKGFLVDLGPVDVAYKPELDIIDEEEY